jgi:diacylglycerol kinase family enzyme
VSGVTLVHKYFGGKLAFGSVALKQLITYRPHKVGISIDEGKIESQKIIGIVIGNGHYCAGGMLLTPGAVPNDAFFDVLVIKEMKLLNRIKEFPKIYSGKHVHSKHFTLYRSQTIVIDSQEKVLIEADGEFLGYIPCRVEIIPSAVRIRYNPVNAQ